MLGDREQGKNIFLYIPSTHFPQGKTLRKLSEGYSLYAALSDAAVRRYSLSLDDLPPLEDEKACAAYEAALCRDFSNAKMIRANTSGPSNPAPGASASTSESVEAEMEGQEDEPGEFVVEEPEETTVNDGPDLVRSYLLYGGPRVELSVGRHRTGYVVCHDTSR